jgi:hypothetical protein
MDTRNQVKIFLMILFSLFMSYQIDAQVLRKDFFGSVVNWSDYSIFVESKEEIPKILVESDLNQSEFGFYNLSDSRNYSYKRAKSSNRSKLNRSLENLYFDENYTVGEWMDQDTNLKSKIISYYNGDIEIENKKIQQNFLSLKSTLVLRGNNNLISMFYTELGGEDFPEYTDGSPEVEFTGLLIDLRDHQFNPSLFPKIQNEYGADLFNKFMVHPASVQEIGMVGYYSNPKDPNLIKRIGKNPYKLYPIQITGKNKTNIILPYEEGKKILSSSITKRNLKLCKIAILVN